MRVCRACGEEKSREAFYKNMRTGRLSLRCLDCGPPKHDTNKWLHSTIRALLVRKLNQAKYNAKRNHVSFGISIDDLMEMYADQDGLCMVSKVKMAHCMTNTWANVSIDRLDNNKGYELGNIRLVCSAVNTMRNRMSDEELIWWAKQISRNGRG